MRCVNGVNLILMARRVSQLSNGRCCHNEDLMALLNGVIIVYQDKDAYSLKQGVNDVKQRGDTSYQFPSCNNYRRTSGFNDRRRVFIHGAPANEV